MHSQLSHLHWCFNLLVWKIICINYCIISNFVVRILVNFSIEKRTNYYVCIILYHLIVLLTHFGSLSPSVSSFPWGRWRIEILFPPGSFLFFCSLDCFWIFNNHLWSGDCYHWHDLIHSFNLYFVPIPVDINIQARGL